MFKIQDRNLFGKWTDDGREFATIEEAREFCLNMADSLNIAYRVIDDSGAVIDVIDLEADFWALGQHDQPDE